MSDFQNVISSEDTQDLGTAIQKLIRENINTINTAFLARVESVKANRVNVKSLMIREDESEAIINNVLIAQPYSNAWHIQFNASVGDIGLCIVSKHDISTYKTNGAGGVVNTNRVFDITDSIFIPLSLYLQENAEELGFVVKNKEGGAKIEFTREGELIIQSPQPITIKTNKTLLDCFNVILDNLENALRGGVTSGSATSQTITSLPNLAPMIQQMKTLIEGVLK